MALGSPINLTASCTPEASPPSLDVESNSAFTIVPAWCEQVTMPGLCSEQAPQSVLPHDNSVVSPATSHSGTAVGETVSVSPSLHGATNFDFSAQSPLVFQFAMSDSPMFDANNTTFAINPCVSLFSTSPLVTSVILEPGQSPIYNSPPLASGEEPSPSELMYSMALDSGAYSAQLLNNYQDQTHAHLGALQSYPYQINCQTPPLPTPQEDLQPLLFSPSFSSTSAIGHPSPPKSQNDSESDLYFDTDDEPQEENPKRRRRHRVRKPAKPKEDENNGSPVKLMCPHPGCSVTCASIPSLARHEATHEWKGHYPPLRCEACLGTLSNEYSVQRHINRSKPGSLCRLMRVYSFMKSATEPKKTVRFYPKRAHGKKTVVVDLSLIRTKFMGLRNRGPTDNI
ncbi:hypothetical protein BGW41_000296 [Actinomortierella wolfii]|nr:hypothetical protein BGW41_000296 [Actinomortierella wolfii]